MFKKNQFPLGIFIIFEKLSCIVYNSEHLTKNHYLIFAASSYIKNINYFLKNNSSYGLSYNIDASTIDAKNFNEFFVVNHNNLLNYYMYNSHTLQIKITLLFLNNKNIVSLENVYPSLNWSERELNEMFGCFLYKKKDNRLLLLDYTKNEGPLLKTFPVEGYDSVYYNFFNGQVAYFNHEFIEL